MILAMIFETKCYVTFLSFVLIHNIPFTCYNIIHMHTYDIIVMYVLLLLFMVPQVIDYAARLFFDFSSLINGNVFFSGTHLNHIYFNVIPFYCHRNEKYRTIE